MAKNESILAIDIGSDSLKFAEFLYPSDGGLCLDKFLFTEYPIDANNPHTDVVQSILKEKIRNFNSKKVRVSLSGKSAFVRFVHNLALGGETPERVEQIIAYEALQNIPYAVNEIVWDYQLLNDPNAADSNGEADVMIVVVKNEFISTVIETLEAQGKSVVGVEVSPTACFNACYANDVGYDGCEMLINIGGKSTTLLFVDKGNLFIRTINIAGHTITQQIAKEFDVPYEKAEEMKRRHGFVALGGAYEEPDSQVAATVSKIVRNVMTRLHGEVNRSINVYRSQHSGVAPKKVYLAGGSSIMAYAPRFFSEKLRVPVDFLNPFKVLSINENIDKKKLAEVAHGFSEIIGLGLSYGLHCPVEINLVPDKIKQQRDFSRKRIYFISSAITIIMLLVVNLYTMKNVTKDMSKESHDAKKQSQGFETRNNKIKKIDSSVRNLTEEYKKDLKLLENRTKWTQILNDFQSRLPDNVWIESFTTAGDVAVLPDGSSPSDMSRGSGSLFEDRSEPPPNPDEQYGSPEDANIASFNVDLGVKSIVLVCNAYVEEANLTTTYADVLEANLLQSPFVDTKNTSSVITPITKLIFLPAKTGVNIEHFVLQIRLAPESADDSSDLSNASSIKSNKR